MTQFAFGDDRLPTRFWAKVKVDEAMGCWLWTGSDDREGYGWFWFDSRSLRAHRVAYEALAGPIPAGLQVDHLCRNHPCVYPGHLEPVTLTENVRRGEGGRNMRDKTHCPQGHAYDAENTYLHHAGWRQCRACALARMRAYYKQRQQVALR